MRHHSRRQTLQLFAIDILPVGVLDGIRSGVELLAAVPPAESSEAY